jgi:hypothetical protein
VVDGALPWAARAAAADGIDVGDRPWGLLTPCHWQVGRDHVSLADPDILALDEAGSRECLNLVRELFESEGFTLAWGAPLRWYASHPQLAGLRSASLDRVLGRPVDPWLRGPDLAPDAQASLQTRRMLRRLQSEVQLLLYPHAFNEAREAAGQVSVNSFWISGCGALPTPARESPAVGKTSANTVTVDERLRAPLLQHDLVAWAQAWREIDAGPLRALLEAQKAGSEITLTLCGERSAERWASTRPSPWQRLRQRLAAPLPHQVLETL